jgi:hypothetical protein
MFLQTVRGGRNVHSDPLGHRVRLQWRVVHEGDAAGSHDRGRSKTPVRPNGIGDQLHGN